MATQRPTTSETRYAVRCSPNAAVRHQLEQRLRERGATNLTWFDAKDDDELNQLACNRRFDAIVYERVDLLLAAIWKGDVDWPRWMKHGMRVDVDGSTDDPPYDLKTDMAHVAESYANWRRADLRRRIIAGLLLSVAGLVALLVLLQTTPIAK